MSFSNPSLASATNTRLDSACKHIQQCRVSYDHMLDFVHDAHELERKKMQYCVHKDEMVVGVGRPWKRSKALRAQSVSAYPRVISNLGDITDAKYDRELRMLKYVYHFTTSLQKRAEIIQQMENTGGHSIPLTLAQSGYLNDAAGTPLNLTQSLGKMYDFYSVGVSNTLGYAHPNSGDTMTSVMIGGLRTVMNGDFDIFAGDLVQWYWTFESNCFHTDGSRKKIADAAGTVASNADPEVDYQLAGPVAPALPHDPRRIYNDYQYGVGVGKSPADKCKHVARIKPYIRDDDQPRLYDWVRVFGVALSSARKNEMVDIKIGRQSM
jgi:hypothetical protein